MYFFNQNINIDVRNFAHKMLSVHFENEKKGLPNELDIEDIKGASATILIAGGNTVSCLRSDTWMKHQYQLQN